MTNLEDAVKRLAAYSAMRADAKVDGIGPKGGIKRVPASNVISILDNGSERRELHHSDLKTVLAAAEQFDGILVRALTLPVWGDVEDELVKAYRDTEASVYDGVQEVYGEVLEMLAMNLVLARAALAGDDDGQEETSALDEIRAERARQDAKWGPQNHPDGTGLSGDSDGARHARKVCQQAAAAGTLAWRHILREEVNEAFAEADPAKLREELVQVAAVAVAWIEAIDRRHKPEQEDAPAVSGWPPRAGDVWRDPDGDEWMAVDTHEGVWMRLRGRTGGMHRPRTVRDQHGPLTFVTNVITNVKAPEQPEAGA